MVLAPPSYSELAITESHRRHFLHGVHEHEQEHASAALLTYITEFRYLPPPLYAEVNTNTLPVSVQMIDGTLQFLCSVLFRGLIISCVLVWKLECVFGCKCVTYRP